MGSFDSSKVEELPLSQASASDNLASIGKSSKSSHTNLPLGGEDFTSNKSDMNINYLIVDSFVPNCLAAAGFCANV